MGSATHVTPQRGQTAVMADEKKSIKDLLKKPFQKFFNRKDKRKNKDEREKKGVKEDGPIDAKDKAVDDRAGREEKTSETDQCILSLNKLSIKEEEDNEFNNFSYKVIEDKESRCARLDSHKSEDSGFSEKVEVESEDEKEMKEDEKETKDDEKRKKKVQTVVISRAPIQNRHNYAGSAHPYSREQDLRQISQINKQTFSGGQVIVNENARADNILLNQALELVDTNVREFNRNTQEEQVKYWQMAEEFINEKTTEDTLSSLLENDICQLSGYPPKIVTDDVAKVTDNLIGGFDYQLTVQPPDNPIEEFSNENIIGQYESDILSECILNPEMDTLNVFPTPPRSENVPSPMSDNFYPSNSPSNYTLSPETSSPIYNSDYERYQDIFSEYPSVIDTIDEQDTDNKTRERTPSTSMTMKQYKDMQKEIANEFSKMECCQANRKSCKEIFQGHLNKLRLEHRKMLCHKVASLDLTKAYGVLQHILGSLSSSTAEDHLQLALFSLICEKVLALSPELFVGEFGLDLLKSAVLRCPSRPLLTRYLVQCVRAVTRSDKYKPTHECVFTEVDALRDNLIIACARGGDAFALPLYELVSKSTTDLPLFTIHHANADGYTALHVACSTHSAAAPRAHVAHVLLEHAACDLWAPDIKGGETALHLAVNSANCDLKLIMILFRNIDRKLWKKLAHTQNRSSVTPLEYARSASKSSNRHNFPIEVLEFLKKCR